MLRVLLVAVGGALGSTLRYLVATVALPGWDRETGAWTSAWLNVAFTTAACLALCVLGLTTGRLLLAPR